MPILELPSQKLNYQIKFSKKRKTIGISVDRDNGLSVYAPEGTSQSEINQILMKKQNWITQKIQIFSEVLPPPPPKEFVSGERLPYIGRYYRLQVERKDTKSVKFEFHRGKFIATVPNTGEKYSENIKKLAIKWYKNQALKKIQNRVDIYAPKVGEYPTKIRIRNFKMRWGTCQENGTIDFNWRIIMAPMSIIDYVVVHELCHLVVKNHSKAYWRKVSAIIVDYKKRIEWLRINGAQLTI